MPKHSKTAKRKAPEVPQKRRGRPPGAKNKAKAPSSRARKTHVMAASVALPTTAAGLRSMKGAQVFLTVGQLVVETGSARETIVKRFDACKVVPAADGKYRLRDAIGALYGGEGQEDPSQIKDPFRRQAVGKAMKQEFELQKMMGQLISVDDVTEERARQFKIVAQMLESLPDILERDTGMQGDQLVQVERVIDKVRLQLVDALNEPGPEPETDNPLAPVDDDLDDPEAGL